MTKLYFYLVRVNQRAQSSYRRMTV
uniref:Uncharacterized protein n=1 Tax=Rhizophora mucronata TaxID=61149 RepID=A0A2P2NLV6_RHIMU